MEKTYIEGLFIKKPHENAPKFVLAKGSINVAKMRKALDEADGEWINFDIKVGKNGDVYAQVDNWKLNKDKATTPANNTRVEYPEEDINPEDVPF